MYAEIQAAIASARLLADIIGVSKELRESTELATAVSDITTKLLHVSGVALAGQEKQAALACEITELKEKIREVENWECQMKRYALFQFPTGALAYALQPGMEQGQPLHHLCTTCVDKKQKSTLQPHGRMLRCPVCKTNIVVQERPPISVNHGSGSWMA